MTDDLHLNPALSRMTGLTVCTYDMGEKSIIEVEGKRYEFPLGQLTFEDSRKAIDHYLHHNLTWPVPPPLVA